MQKAKSNRLIEFLLSCMEFLHDSINIIEEQLFGKKRTPNSNKNKSDE